MDGIRRSAVTGFVWTTFQKVGAQATAFIVFAILARILSPKEFGLVALATVFVAFLSLFTGAAITAALVQKVKIEADHLDAMFWTLIGMSLCLGTGAYFAVDIVAGIFEEPELPEVFRWLLLCLVFNAAQQVHLSLLRRDLQFRSLALRSLISEPIAGTLGIAMALMGFGVWSLVARTIASAVIQAAVLWWKSGWRPRFRYSVPHMKELIAFGASVFGSNLLDFAGRRLDVFLIGYVLGTERLGVYTVAKRLITIMVELIGGTVDNVFWPIFSRIQENVAQVVDTFYEATRYIALAALPVFVGLSALSDELIPVLFGAQWADTAKLMQVLAIVGLIQSIVRFHEALLVGLGRPFFKLRLQALLAAANLFALYLTLENGLMALALGYAVVACALAPLWVIQIRSLVPLEFGSYLKNYGVAALATAVMVLAIMLADGIGDGARLGEWKLVVKCVLGFFAYVLTIAIFYGPTLVRHAGRRRNSAQGKR